VKFITREIGKNMKTFIVEAKQIDRFQVEAVSGENTIVIDQPKAAGGNGAGACPVEYVLAGFAACILNVAYVVASERGIELRSLSVRVEGDLNPARFMGKETEDRAGFQSIRLITNIDADLNLEEKEDFLRAVEARCPVSDNLANTTPVDVILEEKARA
jgi:putative redox protein